MKQKLIPLRLAKGSDFSETLFIEKLGYFVMKLWIIKYVNNYDFKSLI